MQVHLYRVLKHYNVFGYNDTGMVENLPHPIVENPLAHAHAHEEYYGGANGGAPVSSGGGGADGAWAKLKSGLSQMTSSAPTLPTAIIHSHSSKSSTPIKKGI